MNNERLKPLWRPRRLRRTENLRSLVRETRLSVDDLVMPMFVAAGHGIDLEIPSMPGIHRYSIDRIGKAVGALLEAGVTRVILFGIPETKDGEGSDAISDEGIVQQAIQAIRKDFPEMYVMTDICMCEYTDHGHCGILASGDVDNDATLPYLGRQAVSHARAGADMVAPSGMMDGMVAAIRQALDSEGFDSIPIMSYSVKYASAFYSPFRDAAESTPASGDRKSYQMDPGNAREALREAELDVEEGADILMVKPALAYLDVIARLKDASTLPIACYNVSGEYSMVKAAGRAGFIDEDRVMMEMLTGMKRAGADIILTYFAKDAARLLRT